MSPRLGDDPATVPVREAATVLVVRDRPRLEVLCLRRRSASAFVGGMTVFPGGGLDDHDRDPAYRARVVGLGPAEADARLGVRAGALGYWVAVVRETFEEVGVLLAAGRDGTPPPAAALAERTAVDRGDRTLLEVLEAYDLVVDLGRIMPVARWITPEGPPRRYDTRFFVAAMPEGQHAEVDAVEAVHGEWCRPAEALAAAEAGERAMLPPTRCLLGVLARFDRVGPLMDAARRSRGPGGTPRLVTEPDGSYRVRLPGDDGYDDPRARDLSGWVHEL